MSQNSGFLQELPIDSIVVSDRARTELGDLNDLKNSIPRCGQLQAILVDQNYNLVSGERRLRAMQELGYSHIRAIVGGDLDASDRWMAELFENTDRKSFEWYEEVSLKLKIHELYVSESPDWSYADTSRKLGISKSGLSTDLDLAYALRVIPDLKDCPTKGKARTAYTQLRKRVEAAQAIETLDPEERNNLSVLLDSNQNSNAPVFYDAAEDDSEDLEIYDTPYESETQKSPESQVETSSSLEVEPHESHERISSEPSSSGGSESGSGSSLPKYVYEICSYRDILPQIPDGLVGFAELDPPYAIDFNNVYGQLQDIATAEADWSVETFHEELGFLLPVLFEKLAPDSFVIVWTGFDHISFLLETARAAGFKLPYGGRPCLWIKPSGSTNSLRTNAIYNYEAYLLFRKGSATFNTKNFLAAREVPQIPPSRKYHKWQKPAELYDYIFEAMAQPGRLFFSPFAGSGESMLAAIRAGMTPIGCDISQKFFPQFYKQLKEQNHAD